LALVDIFRHSNKEALLNIPASSIDLSDVQKLFVCRKAAGYFFLEPIIAASIVVSVMRTADDALAEDLEWLLFNPLLVNYGGALRRYLGGITNDDRAHKSVQRALEHADRYLRDLNSVGEIRELRPSEHRRQLERLRAGLQMQEAMDAAQKASVLLSLVKRSVLLYGRRSVTYITDRDGSRRPVEMELKSFGGSFEWPRLESIDPVGLEFMLRVLKAEQLRS
jgi:hypothetical protein